MTAPVRAWDRWFFADIDARRLAALRIGAGLLAFLTLLGWAPQVELFFTDAGWLPAHDLLSTRGEQGWSLLYLMTSPVAVKLFLGFSLAAALAMTLGIFARAATWATFIALVSFQHRDTLLVYGGDMVLRLLVLGVALGPNDRALSIDSWRRRRAAAARTRGSEVDTGAPPCEAGAATMPAWPLRLLQIQIALVYFMAGISKLHGSTWRNGSAIATALTVPPLSRFDLAPLLARAWAPAVLTAMGLATTFWELTFPLLVCTRPSRRFAIWMGFIFHLGIIVIMRIHWFGYVMITSYLAFVPEEALSSASRRLRTAFARVRAVAARRGRAHEGCARCSDPGSSRAEPDPQSRP